MKTRDLEPGDIITLPLVGDRIVADVTAYGDQLRVSVYQHGEEAYENKATAHGRGRSSRLVRRLLAHKDPDQEIQARKGDPARAAELEAELIEQDEIAADRAARRWART